VPPLQAAVIIPFTIPWDWNICLKICKIAEKYFLRIYCEFIGERRGAFLRTSIPIYETKNIFVYRKHRNESRIQYLHYYTQTIQVDKYEYIRVLYKEGEMELV
jgi:hypothetical protein